MRLLLVCALALAFLCVAWFPVFADDARDRKAKAVVAVAAAVAKSKAPAAPATAPAPHEPAPHDSTVADYAAAYQRATNEQVPFVVYVRCDPPAGVPGAVVSHVQLDEFAGVKAPAVVVGYPSGDRMVVDAVLGPSASTAEIEKAARTAAKKTAEPMPKSKPTAPPPLASWYISTAPAAGCANGRCPLPR